MLDAKFLYLYHLIILLYNIKLNNSTIELFNIIFLIMYIKFQKNYIFIDMLSSIEHLFDILLFLNKLVQ